MRRFSLAFAPALFVRAIVALFFCACSPAVPGTPTYEADVRPIFMARCVRCHGAGGTLNGDMAPDGTLLSPGAPSPPGPYLDHYEDQDCTDPPDGGPRPANCKIGALTLRALIKQLIHAPAASGGQPPPPATPLDDWQKNVIDRWVENPICSTAPSPNPVICPPGIGP
jgi:hypothetical protein